MPASKQLTLYLPDWLRWQVERRKHVFFRPLCDLFEARGWQVELRGNGLSDRLASHAVPGWGVFYEDAPTSAKTLTVRQSYLEPFWHLERSAKRWEFDVARTPFDPGQVDPGRAAHFVKFWRERLELPPPGADDGFVYVPLQGRITKTRSFQSMSPLELVRRLAEREPDRQLFVTLHPRETYTDEDRAALDQVCASPNVVQSDKQMAALLPSCSYIATQNSSVAISGFLLGKPCLLFAEIDFHHLAASVPRDGFEAAFHNRMTPPKDAARYLFWFFQQQALNVWRPEFSDRLEARLAAHGCVLSGA